MQKPFVFIAFLVFSLSTSAQALTLDLVINDPNALNHYPGPDGLIGTADDVVSALPTTLNASGPNVLGSYSYNAFDFGSGATDPALPTGKNAVTLIEGNVSIDTNIAALGGGAIITGFDVSGTEPFPFHGPYQAQTIAVNSGTYNPATGAFTLNIDFTASLTSGLGTAVNFSLSGEAWYVEAANFGVASGNAYVDNVLIPLAQSQNAASLCFAQGAGTVPGSTGPGLFPPMPVEAVFVGLAPVPLPAPILLLASALVGLFTVKRKVAG